MGNPYVYWGLLALILVAFCLLAFCFTRRVVRIAALAVGVATIVWVTRLGLPGPHHRRNYYRAFQVGGNHLAATMLGVLPGVHGGATLGRGGWIALLVVLLALLACFDTWAVRREQPRVSIPKAPKPLPGEEDFSARRELTEKLQFSLPAVDVRRPAAMPGGSATASLASVTAATGVQGSGLVAALLQLSQAIQAQPRCYQVRVCTESGRKNGVPAPGGARPRVTVEVREQRTGQSVAVQVLQPCQPDELAARVAGYTARQIFRHDPATPAWAAGSFDGADLCAYLLARQTCPAGRTYRDWCECREKRRRRLERVVGPDQGAGVVGYDLAGLYNLDGENVQALLIHLDNRIHYPQFWRGRFRLAVSLSTLAGAMAGQSTYSGWIEEQQQQLARRWTALTAGLSHAGMLRHLHLPAAKAVALPEVFPDDEAGKKAAGRVLLRVARREMRACWRHHHVSLLLGAAFWQRRIRGPSLASVPCLPKWWRHLRRRLWSLEFARAIVRQRIRALDLVPDPDGANEALCRAQRRARRRLRRPEPPEDGKTRPGNGPGRRLWGRWLSRQPRSRARAWRDGRVPWYAVYNAACLHALPESSVPANESSARVTEDAAHEAVELLRLAISNPECDLDRPSERLATDPSLRSLRGYQEFRDLVREQAGSDFDIAEGSGIAPGSDLGDAWFRKLLGPEGPIPEPRPASNGHHGLLAAGRTSRSWFFHVAGEAGGVLHHDQAVVMRELGRGGPGSGGLAAG
jgi:hypothetical protein